MSPARSVARLLAGPVLGGVLVSVSAAVSAEAAIRRVPVDAPTIAAAIAVSQPGDTIQLVGNGGSTYPERLIIDKDITIEGGWRADFAFRDPTLFVSVIRDTTNLYQRSVVRIDGSPRVTFDGVWFIGGRLGIEATDGADLVLRDCLFRSQRNELAGFRDQPGGALHMTGGTLLMEGTTIRNIITSFPGAGLGLDGVQTATVRNTLIEQTNTRPFVQGIFTPAPGGGIWARDVGDLFLEGVRLNQTASQFHWAGGLYAENTRVTAAACSVSQAFAATGGGGLHFENCPSVTITDSSLDGSFGTEGGGLHALGVDLLSVRNTTISGNRVTGRGGGVWMSNTTFDFQDLVVDGNALPPSVVPVKGGGVWALNSTGTVARTVLSGGTVAGAGGGWFQIGGDVVISDTQIRGNTSSFFGGGVHIELAGRLRLAQCLLEGNTGKLGGAASASFNALLEMDHCTVTGNSGQSQGAALYLDTAASATVTNSNLCCAPLGDLVHCSSATVSLSHCNVWNDSSVNVRAEFGGSCPDPTGSNGNLKVDPQFCNAPGGDFSVSQGSPLVGAASDGGLIGTGNPGCPAPLALEEDSWGAVKARYRDR